MGENRTWMTIGYALQAFALVYGPVQVTKLPLDNEGCCVRYANHPSVRGSCASCCTHANLWTCPGSRIGAKKTSVPLQRTYYGIPTG